MGNNWSFEYQERVSPNIGILSVEQQEQLRAARVAIAGCGAIGGSAASELAYWGLGALNLSDFDVFETSNANRQLFAAFSTVGKPKVDVVACGVLDISPDIDIRLYPDGITPDNADDFVADCAAVIDAIDYEKPLASVALHRAARQQNIPVYLAQCVGFGASLYVFRHKPGEMIYEELLGLDPRTPIEQVCFADIDLMKLCPLLPSYIDSTVLQDVLDKKREAPTVVSGQTIAVGLTVTELVMNITHPDRAPRNMVAFDPFLGIYVSEESPSSAT